MSTPDLFSFLDGAPSGDEDKDEIVPEPLHVDKKIKRRASTDPPGDRASGSFASKKPRVSSPVPVVVDEFETEAKREMAASGGLTGSVEAGSRLELRHQVSTNHSDNLHLSIPLPGPPPSCHTTGLSLCADRTTYTSSKTGKGIQVHS
jgi:hypothetical protein